MPSIKYSISLEKQAYCQSKYVPSFCVKTYPVSTHHDWKMWIPQPVGDWLLKVDVTVKLLKIQSCRHREVSGPPDEHRLLRKQCLFSDQFTSCLMVKYKSHMYGN